MKKVYLMAVAALFGSASMAQVSVTFQVDMNGETVSANGVHVAGTWQNGLPDDDNMNGDWIPGANMMTDEDADGIYELTATVEPGAYRFKFINGSDWNPDGTNLGNESVPGEVAIGGDRFFAVSDWHGGIDNPDGGLILPAIPYNGTAPTGKVAVRLNVNMTNETTSAAGVHVAGSIITPNWTPEYGTCTPFGVNEFGYVTYVDENATYEYKFINGGTFADPNENVTDAACGLPSGNRTIDIGAETTVTESFCYNSCETCADPNVTLTVDLTTADANNGGYIAGDFTGWGSGVPMEDNGDGTYTYAGVFPVGVHQFKFLNGPGGYEAAIVGDFICTNEDGNRFFEVVGEDPVVYTACYSQCGETCVTADPANITFQVDMNAEIVSADGVWLIGDFTDFQTNAIQLGDGDSDGVYTSDPIFLEGNPFIAFKYVNGDVNVSVNEESADFAVGGCGLPNGIGGWNRIHTRSGVDEVLPVVAFNSCQPLSTTEVELGRVSIYPNPSDGVSFIEVENPNNHTLRMNIVDITGKVVTGNMLINTTRYEINTTDLNSGLYFLNIVNERSERAVYKLMVQ